MTPILPRLSGEKIFSLIYRQGRRISNQSLIVSYWCTTSTNTKIAVVVSKKISHKANKRNFYKRRIWGCLREVRHLLPKNTLIIITTKPTIKDLSYKQTKQDLINILEKI